MRRANFHPIVLVTAVLLLLVGCDGGMSGSYKNETAKAMYLFRYGKFAEAADALKTQSLTQGKNQLLYLYERGMFLHSGKLYAESTKAWLKASNMLDHLDIISIHESAFSVVAGDKFKTYRGEDFEKVLLNTFLAINFMMQGNYEEALVEFRQANQKLEFVKKKYGENRDYVENAFTRYLMAICYEALGQDNDAYIEYKRVYALMPKLNMLAPYLIGHSATLGFNDELAQWQKIFGQTKIPKTDANHGELIILFECGLAPEKFNQNGVLPYPEFSKRNYRTKRAEISVDNKPTGTTQLLYDIESVSRNDLQQRLAHLIAKRIGGKVLKEGAAYFIQKKTGSKELAWGFRILAHAGEGADLRSWLSLPGSLQLFRVRLPKGVHQLRLDFKDKHNRPSRKAMSIKTTIHPGKKTILLVRTIDD